MCNEVHDAVLAELATAREKLVVARSAFDGCVDTITALTTELATAHTQIAAADKLARWLRTQTLGPRTQKAFENYVKARNASSENECE